MSEANDPVLRFAHTSNDALTPETTMLTLVILAPIVLILTLSILLRLITLPFRLFHPRRTFLGHSPYPGAYSRGFYPRPRFGGLLSIACLYAIDRLFGRRW